MANNLKTQSLPHEKFKFLQESSIPCAVPLDEDLNFECQKLNNQEKTHLKVQKHMSTHLIFILCGDLASYPSYIGL